MAADSADRPRRWASASELAQYEFCPRAWWYDAHEPPGGATYAGERAVREGARYHAKALAAEWRRERSRAAEGVAIAAVLLVLVGGVLWVWH